jgi:hypothetical protein
MWQLIIMQVFDFVEDGWCFSPFSFMKSKLQNWLTTHLDVVIWIFVQKFYALENALYHWAIGDWKVAHSLYPIDA